PTATSAARAPASPGSAPTAPRPCAPPRGRNRASTGGGGVDGDAAAAPCYAQVVVEVAPDHLDRPFDYRVPDGAHVAVGQRVRVVFAGRRRTGWVVGLSDTPSTDPARIRPLSLLQGERTWFDADDLPLWRWVADRYCAPLASV